MYRDNCKMLAILLLVTFIGQILGNSYWEGQKRAPPFEECAMFKDPDLDYVKQNGPSYIELDVYDFTGDLEVSFWVLPDKTVHNGPLFNVGTKDFKYYEWKAKAVFTQFLVIEIASEAVAMLLKAKDTNHLQTIELYSTYPTPYDLIDGKWQHIHAYRKDAVWHLILNGKIEVKLPTTKDTDVNMWDRGAYLGGRPGYQENVFRGIIKELYVNGDLIQLSGKPSSGNVEVDFCNSEAVENFARKITSSDEEESEYGYQGDQPYNYIGKKKSKLNKKLSKKRRGGRGRGRDRDRGSSRN